MVTVLDASGPQVPLEKRVFRDDGVLSLHLAQTPMSKVRIMLVPFHPSWAPLDCAAHLDMLDRYLNSIRTSHYRSGRRAWKICSSRITFPLIS